MPQTAGIVDHVTTTAPDHAVVAWLLVSDPAIRWQVLQDESKLLRQKRRDREIGGIWHGIDGGKRLDPDQGVRHENLRG